ncbi:metallophosphoesterase [Sphingomonas prati]|uniref:Calcineurin-like phosphoesterase family protein n=1 Tax=Sphingomonas prati TaxID=1843237 RepID=A0A7W9BVM8_9SPHN|nr:metallophosphoesterase [Sphingomonas prati]MBB5730979.1 calcineurin-like phosphoesterase family protein [Sphingomonas prati]GGE98245.1 hypothetical protein GCM10011404_34240 [Sphingomonas prati]
MSAIFVHVSDIHFGQERDHVVHIHDDVKRELVADATAVVAALPASEVKGILVTGDVAYSGKAEQYEAAGEWLDALAGGIGCPIHRVQMVPGNHDLDRDKLSIGGSHLLEYIRQGGPAEYEKVVSNDDDRATLFRRFEDYGRFCIGYNCGLDLEAKLATNMRVEVGPGRWIRFVRLNSSLLCHGAERHDPPELVIGERQFTIPRNAGEENVVLVHHPLNWYKDEADVRDYVRSRARVFISGHEHNPKVHIDEVDNGCDVMMLAAGAAVPFKSNDIYTYTYNVIEFDWDDATDSLVVTMHPRAWNPRSKVFEADHKRLGGEEPCFTLGSPNFRKVGARPPADAVGTVADETSSEAAVELVPADNPETSGGEEAPMPPDAEGYELAMLRFFRNLYEGERLRILVELDALPVGSDERMNQGLELRLFDWLARAGKLPEAVAMIDRLINEREERDA